MKRTATLNEFVVEQMNHLLTTLAFAAHRASNKPGPDEIHDLRVSIRRFTQGLLLFPDFFPKWEVKKIKRMLKRMMRLTSEIRNRDIALEFLHRLEATAHRQRLQRERTEYQRQFEEMVRRWSARDFSAKWRNRLSLSNL